MGKHTPGDSGGVRRGALLLCLAGTLLVASPILARPAFAGGHTAGYRVLKWGGKGILDGLERRKARDQATGSTATDASAAR